jgi:hypothetical protein
MWQKYRITKNNHFNVNNVKKDKITKNIKYNIIT